MKTLNLTRSSVVFDQEAHTYHLDGVELSGRVLITRVAATTRESLDSKSLKADNPELYAKYVKTSPVKESLKITVRS